MGKFQRSMELKNVEDSDEIPFRYLVITDLHLRVKEQSNRKNILEKYNTLLSDIHTLITTTGLFNGVILLGDVWDRGVTGKFTDIISQVELLKEISESVNGNLYTMFGNHEEQYCKDNPFYSFTELPPELLSKLKSKKEIPPFIAPIMIAPMQLTHKSGTIWFNHFDRHNKNYKVVDADPLKVNIGLYHDDIVTTETKAKLYHHKIGEGIDANSDIFDNIDWAICGHNHQPQSEVILGNKIGTLITIPGTPVQNRVDEVHTEVRLPVIEFYEDRVDNKFIVYNMGDITETIIQNPLNEKKKIMRKALKSYKLILKKSTIEECLQKAQHRRVAEIIMSPERVYQSDNLYREMLNIK